MERRAPQVRLTRPTRLSLWTFSGTGNTLLVARWMVAAAEALGIEARTERIDGRASTDGVDVEPGSMIGVLMPTHGFTAPWIVWKTLWRFPRSRGATAFCVATRGGLKFGPIFTPGMAASACFVAALFLALKGYRVRGVIGIDMPSNWTSLHSALQPLNALAIADRAEVVARRFAAKLFTGGRNWLTLNVAYDLFFGVAWLPVSVGYLAVGRAGLGKLFFATNACNACGLCEAACPVGAVQLRGERPFWTWDCESCMRCMSFCPHKAIEVSHAFAALLCVAMTVPVLPWVFGRVLPPWLDWPLSTFLWALELVVCYRLLWWLSGVRWVRTLLNWTTATRLYRRHRAPGVRLKDLTGGRGAAKE